MISFTVQLRFRPEDHAEIHSILEELTRLSRQEPGCVSYIPHWVEGQPDTVLIYEQYQDDAATEFHRSTEHFKKYAIGGLYQKMLDRQVETLHAIA
ncbi:putative quinol monooxygenase [Granulicella cerasi]|uniref:Quinol monooxygenase n=1 Tax=Granulicella cerasi TaxID=741063 RepID=A0ABW1ZBY5_9BACT|nr:putative quinol monooxygenase [Granulicella cerasi]